MKRLTIHNLIIADASGSMWKIYDQTLQGINNTITEIYLFSNHNPYTDYTITLCTFNRGRKPVNYIYKEVDSEIAEHIDKTKYCLEGSTALYDAIGDSVTEMRRYMKDDDTAIVTILTDGEENDSQHWNSRQIKSLIDSLKEQGWVFTYIGANQDVEKEAEKIGVANTLKFEATIEGTAKMFEKEARCRRNWNERYRRGERTNEGEYFNEREDDNEPIAMNRITPERIDRLADNEIFVFGSNEAGHHNGGAARAAMHRFGAKYGVGVGLQGQSYAIPTTGTKRSTYGYIQGFISFAKANPRLHFLVTPIGCGNAGHSAEEVAPLFKDAVDVPNIALPQRFWDILNCMR